MPSVPPALNILCHQSEQLVDVLLKLFIGALTETVIFATSSCALTRRLRFGKIGFNANADRRTLNVTHTQRPPACSVLLAELIEIAVSLHPRDQTSHCAHLGHAPLALDSYAKTVTDDVLHATELEVDHIEQIHSIPIMVGPQKALPVGESLLFGRKARLFTYATNRFHDSRSGYTRARLLAMVATEAVADPVDVRVSSTRRSPFFTGLRQARVCGWSDGAPGRSGTCGFKKHWLERWRD